MTADITPDHNELLVLFCVGVVGLALPLRERLNTWGSHRAPSFHRVSGAPVGETADLVISFRCE